jgi:hypothetical protein
MWEESGRGNLKTVQERPPIALLMANGSSSMQAQMYIGENRRRTVLESILAEGLWVFPHIAGSRR